MLSQQMRENNRETRRSKWRQLWDRGHHWWQHRPPYQKWSIFIILGAFSVLGVTFVLLIILALVNLYFSFINFYFFQNFNLLLLAPPLVTLIVGITAGAVAAINLVLSHFQKQEHFDIDALHKRFSDIQSRLASPNPGIAANAAHQLVDLATRPKPYATHEKSLKNYPFFEQATALLASAIAFEENPRLRRELLNAWKRMVEFAAKEANT